MIIPAAADPRNLAECLASVRTAAMELLEPVEVIVVVSGASQSGYEVLRRTHPAVRWHFQARPLEYAEALAAGLRKARFDWVCLLNGDSPMARNAMSLPAPLRDERTFAIASEGWTALLVEDGLVTIPGWTPGPDRVPGTASLFQSRLLRYLLDPAVYDPLSWDAVEWCWRARKLGYRCVTSPHSSKQQAATWQAASAGKPSEALLRNRLLFQLRNFTTAGSLERVVEEIAQAPEAVSRFFLLRGTLWRIARGRLWNHRAPFADDEVLAGWARVAAGAD